MSVTTIEITLDEFFLQFPIIKNHLNPWAVWQNGPEAGGLFETFGEELHFVRQQNPRQIWTLIEDDEGRQFLQSGFHLVNRLAYAVSTRAVPFGTEIQVPVQSELESWGDDDEQ
jgi:hypothetical protein